MTFSFSIFNFFDKGKTSEIDKRKMKNISIWDVKCLKKHNFDSKKKSYILFISSEVSSKKSRKMGLVFSSETFRVRLSAWDFSGETFRMRFFGLDLWNHWAFGLYFIGLNLLRFDFLKLEGSGVFNFSACLSASIFRARHGTKQVF